MKLKVNISIPVFLTLVLYCLSIHAQEDSGIVELESYSVTANRMEISLGKIGVSMTVLDVEDIERFETTLATEAIRYIPGIYVRNNGGLGTSSGISMRGLPVAPLVLIDGIEVNNPASGNVFNFGNLPTQAIGRIEVLRGAQSSLYGSNSLTGVISVTTKQSLELGESINLGASYGSRNTVSGYVVASGNLDWMDYSVVASAYDTDGFSAQPEEFGDEWADDDRHELNTIHGRFGFRLGDKFEANLVIHYHEAEAEYDPGTPSAWSTPIYDNYNSEEQLLVKTGILFQATEQWNLNASFTYNELDDFNQNAYGASDGEAELNKFDLLSHFNNGDRYQALFGIEVEEAADGIGNYSYKTTSLFTEQIFDIIDDLTATLGARYDDNDTYGDETTWRTSFVYNVSTTGLKLKGTYGTGFDAPEISQLFGAYGDPTLVPESGSSYDLGMEWISPDQALTLGVSYFDIDIEDKVEYLRSTNSYANVDWVSRGVEAYVQYNIADDTRLYVSYSYSDAERERVADSLIMHSPEGIFSFMIDQDFLEDKVQLRLSGQHVGERETWDGPTDAFFTMALSASYQINPDLKVWVRVDNLADEEYEEILNYNGAPQSFSIGFNYEL
jgi:vitamin B12 transporter